MREHRCSDMDVVSLLLVLTTLINLCSIQNIRPHQINHCSINRPLIRSQTTPSDSHTHKNTSSGWPGWSKPDQWQFGVQINWEVVVNLFTFNIRLEYGYCVGLENGLTIGWWYLPTRSVKSGIEIQSRDMQEEELDKACMFGDRS